MLPTTGTKLSTWLNVIAGILTGGLATFDPTLLIQLLPPQWAGLVLTGWAILNAVLHATTGNSPQVGVSVTTNPATNTKSLVGPDIAKGNIG